MDYWTEGKEGSCHFLHLIAVEIYKKQITLKLDSGKSVTMKAKEFREMLSEVGEFVFQNTATKKEKRERDNDRKDIGKAVESTRYYL